MISVEVILQPLIEGTLLSLRNAVPFGGPFWKISVNAIPQPGIEGTSFSLTGTAQVGRLAPYWRRCVKVVLHLFGELLSLWSQARKGGLRSSCSQVGKQPRAAS
jgi:hypothetical protein